MTKAQLVTMNISLVITARHNERIAEQNSKTIASMERFNQALFQILQTVSSKIDIVTLLDDFGTATSMLDVRPQKKSVQIRGREVTVTWVI